MRRACQVPWLLLVFLGLAGPGLAQPQPQELTPQQKQQLVERDRHSKESAALEKEGKLAEASAAAQKMLALEREVFGDVHAQVVGSLQRLARLHERREDFAAARRDWQEVVTLQTKLH